MKLPRLTRWLAAGIALTVAGWSVGQRAFEVMPFSERDVSQRGTQAEHAESSGDLPSSRPPTVGVAAATALLAEPPLIIGPTARVIESQSGLPLLARVDTGASVTSLHCTADDFVIEQDSGNPHNNVGKSVRLRVENQSGDSSWITTEVLGYVEVRSANGAEHRYRVRLPLQCGPVHKQAIVNLNDRSKMTYRLLLGRDFLAGNFVVDVSQPGVQSL